MAQGYFNQFVRVIGSGSVASVTTPAMSTTIGSYLVAFASADGATLGGSPISDSASNSWTPLIAQTGATGRIRAWYAVNNASTASHTFTLTPSANDFQTLTVVELIGVTGLGSTATSAALTLSKTAGPLTIGSGYELVLGFGGGSSETTPYTITNPRFAQITQNVASGATEGCISGIAVAPPGASISFTYSTGGIGSCGVCVVSFTIPDGGGSGGSMAWTPLTVAAAAGASLVRSILSGGGPGRG